jgi:hypothetical protein
MFALVCTMLELLRRADLIASLRICAIDDLPHDLLGVSEVAVVKHVNLNRLVAEDRSERNPRLRG